jgi:hypothetical protein
VSTLHVVTWNVCVENKADRIQVGLRELAQSRPHVIALQECYHFRAHLPGYTTYQLPRGKDEHGVVNEDADVAVLIRNDVTVKRHKVARMRTPWIGPKGGKRHAPRVFHTFVLKVDGKVWKFAAAHWAYPADNAAAVAEHKRWTARWLRGFRPAALVGDLNQHASPIHGRRSTGQGVDRAVLARCVGVSRPVKDAHGSDHHPARIELTTK